MEENNNIIENGQMQPVEYTDDNIRHLSDMEHVRTRPGMYIGRLGPLTIATLWYFSNGERISYPEGNIAIG